MISDDGEPLTPSHLNKVLYKDKCNFNFIYNIDLDLHDLWLKNLDVLSE